MNALVKLNFPITIKYDAITLINDMSVVISRMGAFDEKRFSEYKEHILKLKELFVEQVPAEMFTLSLDSDDWEGFPITTPVHPIVVDAVYWVRVLTEEEGHTQSFIINQMLEAQGVLDTLVRCKMEQISRAFREARKS